MRQSIQDSLQGLNDALMRAEQRNAEQTREIERLQAELRAQRARDPGEQEHQRREFYRALRRQLPVSALYEVLPDRLIIANDPVFIFGKGEIGAEGQDRLTPLAEALRDTGFTAARRVSLAAAHRGPQRQPAAADQQEI